MGMVETELFTEQVNILTRYLLENSTPPIYDSEYRVVKYKWVWNVEWVGDKEELQTIIAVGSYYASVLRNTYRRFIWLRGWDPRTFWDAVVKVFMWSGIWDANWEQLCREEKFKELAGEKYEWVKMGLLGGSWKKLKTMCEDYCKCMDKVESELM